MRKFASGACLGVLSARRSTTRRSQVRAGSVDRLREVIVAPSAMARRGSASTVTTITGIRPGGIGIEGVRGTARLGIGQSYRGHAEGATARERFFGAGQTATISARRSTEAATAR